MSKDNIDSIREYLINKNYWEEQKEIRAIIREKFFKQNYGNSAQTVVDTLRNLENLLGSSIQNNLEFDEQMKLTNAAELLELSREEESEEILQDVLLINPGSIEAKINLSVIRIISGQFEEAKSILNKVLEIDPNNEIAIGNINYIAEKGFVNA